jgi:hypothetical protein
MAVINVAALGVWTAQSKNNARQGRALLQALFQNIDATPLNGVRSGVISTVGSATINDGLVTFVSGQQLAVQPFSGIAHRSGQGPYLGWLAAVANPSVDTPPISNPRNDIVIARFYDAAQGDTVPGAGANPMQIEIVTGTPAASPTDPVTPNTLGVITSGMGAGGGVGIPLARAQVAVGGAITITSLQRSAALIGSVRRLLPGDSDVLGARGDLRMNSNSLQIFNLNGDWATIADGGGSFPQGILDSNAPTGAGRCGTGESIQTETVTGAGVLGRRYKISYTQQNSISSGTPTAQTRNFRVQAGPTVTTGGTLIRSLAGPAPTASNSTYAAHCTWTATFSGQATFGVGWFTNGGATMTSPANARELTVEDIGF